MSVIVSVWMCVHGNAHVEVARGPGPPMRSGDIASWLLKEVSHQVFHWVQDELRPSPKCEGLRLEEWQALSPPCPQCEPKESSAEGCLAIAAGLFREIVVPLLVLASNCVLVLLTGAFGLGLACSSARALV